MANIRGVDALQYDITEYTKLTVKIIDFLDVNDVYETEEQFVYAHRCAQIKLLFETRTAVGYCQVDTVTIPPGTTQQEWDDQWETDLALMNEETELLVVIFGGRGGGLNENYLWFPKRDPHNPINATRLIGKIIETSIDCIFFVDGFIQTRWADTWKRPHAHAELISMPTGAVSAQTGQRGQNDGDLLPSVVRNLTSYLDDPFHHPNVAWTHGHMPTFPEIMAQDKDMPSHTGKDRIEFYKGRYACKLRLDPFETAHTHQLKLYKVSVRRRTVVEQEEVVAGPEEVVADHEDEGVGMGFDH